MRHESALREPRDCRTPAWELDTVYLISQFRNPAQFDDPQRAVRVNDQPRRVGANGAKAKSLCRPRAGLGSDRGMAPGMDSDRHCRPP